MYEGKKVVTTMILETIMVRTAYDNNVKFRTKGRLRQLRVACRETGLCENRARRYAEVTAFRRVDTVRRGCDFSSKECDRFRSRFARNGSFSS